MHQNLPQLITDEPFYQPIGAEIVVFESALSKPFACVAQRSDGLWQITIYGMHKIVYFSPKNIGEVDNGTIHLRK